MRAFFIYGGKMNETEKLTLKEKTELCSGKSFWYTKDFPDKQIPSMCLTDGPHGVRKQKGAEEMDISENEISTCFPTACLSACSWDENLLFKMGEAIAQECLHYNVGIILGPGVNIKRSPYCGRNFEYFSEDPLLSGKLGAAWIKGVQSKGVGACVKHFAGNNREKNRMNCDSLIDDRALREIYLRSFEIAIKEGKPASVMSAYNLLNGIYCSDNPFLLNDVLRKEWGFSGFTVSDWGGVNNRTFAFAAGLDLEMPSSKGYFDKQVLRDISEHRLSEVKVDSSANRVLQAIHKYNKQENAEVDFERHDALAREIAAKSAVLLKNEDQILPIKKDEKIALVGEFCEKFRFQGAGSSLINAYKITNIKQGLEESGLQFDYYKGYGKNADLKEFLTKASEYDKIIFVAALPEDLESEGFDRESFALPSDQTDAISAISEINPNIITVLVAGSPVDLSFDQKVKGLLNLYLAGQAGGLACADILTGKVNPSGKLAETYPLRYGDLPCAEEYGAFQRQEKYIESIYVGYRYYDTAKVKVKYPFGFGLSYTSFEYSDINVERRGDVYIVSFNVKNKGTVQGEEISQVYVKKPSENFYNPSKELVGFSKTLLDAGESKTVSVSVPVTSLEVYCPSEKRFIAEKGEYTFFVGGSSVDTPLKTKVNSGNEYVERQQVSKWYFEPNAIPSDKDFESVYGKIPEEKVYKKGNYDDTCTLAEVKKSSLIIKLVYKIIESIMAKKCGGKDYSNPQFKMMMESAANIPFKNMKLMSADMLPPKVIDGLIEFSNGRIFKGIKKICAKEKD